MAEGGVQTHIQEVPNLNILQKAIEVGNIEQAKKIAAQLAELQTKLSITPAVDEQDDSGTIDIQLYIEDKDNASASQLLSVHPSISIKQLKEKVERDYGFPQEIQRWIINKCIRRDTDTLAGLGITRSGHPVHVYMLSASSVGLTREQFEQNQQQQRMPVDPNLYHVPLTHPGGYQPPPAGNPGNLYQVPYIGHIAPPKSAEINPPTLDLNLDVQDNNNHPIPPAPPSPEDLLQSISQVGWRCESCTYTNEPTRPGCAICAADRPADYKPPDVLYKQSESERQRLANIEEDERLAKELGKENPHWWIENLDSMIQMQNDVLANRDESLVDVDNAGNIDPLVLEELIRDELGERAGGASRSIEPFIGEGTLRSIPRTESSSENDD